MPPPALLDVGRSEEGHRTGWGREFPLLGLLESALHLSAIVGAGLEMSRGK